MNRIRITTLGVLCLVVSCFYAPLSVASTSPYIREHGVNFAIGNKHLREHDISITGPVSTLRFARNYNSRATFDAEMGYGWTSSWSERITIAQDRTRIDYRRADGRTIAFVQDDTDTWVNTTGRTATIVESQSAEYGSIYTLTWARGAQEIFDGDGRLIETRDLNNNAVFLSYTAGKLTRIDDGFGRALTFSYNGDGRIDTIESPIGTFTYNYDASGNLLSRTRPDTTTRTYLYEDPHDSHNLTGVIDETQTRIATIGYDDQDRVITSSLTGDANTLTIAYESTLRRVVTDATGAATTYDLAVRHGKAFIQSADGPGCTTTCGGSDDTSYTYNDRGQVETMTDGRGTVTAYTYDDAGNRLTRTRAQGTNEEITTTYTYHPITNRVLTISRPSAVAPDASQRTTMTYDDFGNLETRTEFGYDLFSPGYIECNDSGTECFGIGPATSGYARFTFYTYDDYGRVLTINVPRDDITTVTTFTYYPNESGQGLNRGFLHTVTNALGHTTTYGDYNGFGQPETITDPNGVVTTLTYNDLGLVVSRTTGGRTTGYGYDDAGRLLTLTQPGARTITYGYDEAGRIGSLTDTLGNAIHYSYDAMGRRTAQQIKGADGAAYTSLAYAYDEAGRLHKVINPDDSFQQMDYDEVGNLVTAINELTQTTTYQYDPLGRLTHTNEPLGAITVYSYDIHGNQTSLTDAEGRTTSFTYDDFGNRLSRTAPDTGTTGYRYDIVGNLIGTTDNNGTVTSYRYDVLNRVTEISYPGSGELITYTYDAGSFGIGRLSSVTDQAGSTSYRYDQFGDIVETVRVSDGLILSTGYAYNNNRELQEVTYPSGRTVRVERDDIGRATRITTTYAGETTIVADNLTYLPFGPATTMELGNGVQRNWSFDERYRLTGDRTGTIYQRDYGYTAASQVETITDLVEPTHSQSFVYDELGRLVSATGDYGQITYEYDKTGNRLVETSPDGRRDYRYRTDSSILTAIEGVSPVTYDYSQTGSLISRADQRFAWDDKDRLSRVENDAGDLLGAYEYDAASRRIKSSADGVITYFSYDTGGNLLAAYDENGQVQREYIYLDGRRLMQFDYPDHHQTFSLTVATEDSGPVVGAEVMGAVERGATGQGQSVTTITNEAGEALFPVADFGTASPYFRITHNGLRLWTEPVMVYLVAEAEVLITTHQVQCLVLIGGMARAGAEVTVLNEDGSPTGYSGVTDHTGRVQLMLPEDAAVSFMVSVGGKRYYYTGNALIIEDTMDDIQLDDSNLRTSSFMATFWPAILIAIESRDNTTGEVTSYYHASTDGPNTGTQPDATPDGGAHQEPILQDGDVRVVGGSTFITDFYGDTAQSSTPAPAIRVGSQPTANPLDVRVVRAVSSSIVSAPYWYIDDHLGTPQMMVDNTGAVVWQAAYEPFGSVSLTATDAVNHHRFPGQYFDSESGLHYNWHRFYDPTTGRYISADPIGLEVGINLYIYTFGDPINWYDPEGLNAIPFPFPFPLPLPLPSPAPDIRIPDFDWPWEACRKKTKWTCRAKCQCTPFGPRQGESQWYVYGLGYGPSERDAAQDAEKNTKKKCTRHSYPRHCDAFACWKE
jgi:RHS repeat-associated protein